MNLRAATQPQLQSILMNQIHMFSPTLPFAFLKAGAAQHATHAIFSLTTPMTHYPLLHVSHVVVPCGSRCFSLSNHGVRHSSVHSLLALRLEELRKRFPASASRQNELQSLRENVLAVILSNKIRLGPLDLASNTSTGVQCLSTTCAQDFLGMPALEPGT